ncbi:hypothetical protein V1512DRAFT_261984 [Lipomyces arxii]|uniref:uncharacterized protein n=1 Tax=Lipomyces arxii TaxID=56418 RepID=UPI0034CFE841
MSVPISVSLWDRIKSYFLNPTSSALNDKSLGFSVYGNSTRYGVFSIFSPFSTGSLLASFLTVPKSLLSSLFSSSSSKSISNRSEQSSESIKTSSTASNSTTSSLFPQSVVDSRLTTALNNANANQTATPCATGSSATLMQVHNAGGELVGFDLSDPAMMQPANYLLTMNPQLQLAPQNYLEQQYPMPTLPTVEDQGVFLDRLDELEEYISAMRTRLFASGSRNCSTYCDDSASSATATPLVVRRRNERQSVAAPYSRPVYTGVSQFAVDVNDLTNAVSAYSPESVTSQYLASASVNGDQSSPSLANSVYSPSDSAPWTPPELADQNSPKKFSLDDSLNFQGNYTDGVQPFPDLEGYDGSDMTMFSLTAGNKFAVTADSITGFPQFIPTKIEGMNPPQIPSQEIIFDGPLMMPAPVMSEPAIQVVPTALSRSSSVSSQPTSGSSAINSPPSSNSSPVSSPVKEHVAVHTEPSNLPNWSSSPSSSSFQCPHCQAQFRIKGYLTRHLKKHAVNKAYSCPFYDPTCSTPCHSSGGFSRRDTYKTHLKSRHFVYPAGTRSDQRAGMRGWCAACGMLFACNENWVENHVEGGECRAFQSISMYS